MTNKASNNATQTSDEDDSERANHPHTHKKSRKKYEQGRINTKLARIVRYLARQSAEEFFANAKTAQQQAEPSEDRS
ncbi:MAG: hypothetical protein H7X92_13410 [Chitinophagales bacterium]|nr:hypothetical protein [Hyphomicrobiales bacterium]